MPVRGEEKKKSRPKDVFGRSLPTEEEFEVLKNAPRYVWIFPHPFIKRKSVLFTDAKFTWFFLDVKYECGHIVSRRHMCMNVDILFF